MPDLLPHLRADENAGATARYPVVSLYYDSPARECYWENIDEVPSRRKMRVRLYGSEEAGLPPTCFAEVKHKLAGRNVKRRALLSREEALAVAAGRHVSRPLGRSDERVVSEIHALVHGRGFAPSCCIRYDRHAYSAIDPASDLRLTFDTGIAYRFENLAPLPDDRNFRHYLMDPESAVMEVKVSGVAPYWFTHLLGRTGCVRQSHSKYCRAMEMGDPILRPRLQGRQPSLVVAG